MGWRTSFFLFIAMALLAGCGSPPPKPPVFAAAPEMAKLFVYVYYDRASDKPYFEDTFKIHIDGGFGGEITDGQYIDTQLLPGDYKVTVDQSAWTGNVASSARFKLQLKAGEIAFLSDRIFHDPKTGDFKSEILQVDAPFGMPNIMPRKRVCPC